VRRGIQNGRMATRVPDLIRRALDRVVASDECIGPHHQGADSRVVRQVGASALNHDVERPIQRATPTRRVSRGFSPFGVPKPAHRYVIPCWRSRLTLIASPLWPCQPATARDLDRRAHGDTQRRDDFQLPRPCPEFRPRDRPSWASPRRL